MLRRGFLTSSLATTLAACGGVGGLAQLPSEVSETWPPLGQFVDVDGAKIHAWDQGRGHPVVMIHGASGNLRDWTFDLAPEIARKHRAIAFDRPGFGYSERLDHQTGDPAAQARTLASAARKLGAQKPILVGHSLGAAVAMAWALAEPDSIAGVVSISGAVMPWSSKPMLAEQIGLDDLLVGLYFDYLRSSAPRGGIERFVTRVFRPQPVPEGYLDYVGGPLSLKPSAMAANKQDVTVLNTALRRQAPDYGRIGVPVEVISGTNDFIIDTQRQPIPFAQRLPNSRLTLLDGVGHMAHHVAAEQVFAAIDRIAAAK
ncbi:MAG: alpha/beta fold hydrolase [Paracoccaceae bacterium]